MTEVLLRDMATTLKRSVMEKKVKKKRWVSILAPDIFNKAIVGEIPLTSAVAAQGRVLTANLMNITHDIKQQNINISLQVYEVKENQAFTKINSFKVMPAAIKRMTHRRIEVIEDSSIFVTSDNVRVRIKPVLFTRGNTSSSMKRVLRKGMRNLILRTVKTSKVEELFRDTLSNKLQFAVMKELSKFHPLKNCIIRELSIERERTRKKVLAVESEVEIPKTRKGRAKDEDERPAKKKKSAEEQAAEDAELFIAEEDVAAEAEPKGGKEPEFTEIPPDEPLPDE